MLRLLPLPEISFVILPVCLPPAFPVTFPHLPAVASPLPTNPQSPDPHLSTHLLLIPLISSLVITVYISTTFHQFPVLCLPAKTIPSFLAVVVPLFGLNLLLLFHSCRPVSHAVFQHGIPNNKAHPLCREVKRNVTSFFKEAPRNI